jgi:hypothetical protein
VQVDQLVAELLARGDINDDTTLELNRILEDWRANKLDPDDQSYVEALHARLLHTAAEPVDLDITPGSNPTRVEGLTIEEWRDRALKAEAELADVRDATQNG